MMPNIFWYICLIAVSMVITLITFLKNKERATLFTCYLFSVFIAHIGEFLILFVFKGYIYKPGIFVNVFRDNSLGHIISNTTILSAVATMIVGFSLKYRWIFLVSLIYMLIDIFFVRVGAYQYNWWNLYLTPISLFVYNSFIKIWFGKLSEKKYKFQQYLTLYLIAMTLIFAANYTQFIFLNKIDFVWRGAGLATLTLPKIGQGLGIGIFYFVYSGSRALFYTIFIRFFQKWYWKMAPIIIMGLFDSILMINRVLIFKVGWNLIYFTFIHLTYFAFFILFIKYLEKRDYSLV